MPDTNDTQSLSRRQFFRRVIRASAAAAVAATVAGAARRTQARGMLWQIDPEKCTQCGRCATDCVLMPSAVKCVHAYDVCGYCDLCGGYFRAETKQLNTAAENQLCPVGAIKRTFVEDPYFSYSIDEPLCIGCSKCVKGCQAFGNGSLYLQVRHDRCVNCNDCAIARRCPSSAFRRVPADQPYILKGEQAG